MERSFISKELYRKFTSRMPLSCIEIVVESQGKFILVKRKDPPAKGQWWFPGGRIFFNENSLTTVRRKLKEELGLGKPKLIRFLGLGESRFKKGYFNLPSHTFNAIFLVRISSTQARNIKLDTTIIDGSDLIFRKGTVEYGKLRICSASVIRGCIVTSQIHLVRRYTNRWG